jgi:hypothetical protein
MSPAMRHIKHEITIEYRKEVICMGLLDAIFGNNQPPKINSILPTAAKNEIRAGRLPILNTDSLFLKRGEKIHYIDKAINLEIKVVKQYRHVGHSTPGLLKGNRWNVGVAKPIEHGELVQHRGILYVPHHLLPDFHHRKHWRHRCISSNHSSYLQTGSSIQAPLHAYLDY